MGCRDPSRGSRAAQAAGYGAGAPSQGNPLVPTTPLQPSMWSSALSDSPSSDISPRSAPPRAFATGAAGQRSPALLPGTQFVLEQEEAFAARAAAPQAGETTSGAHGGHLVAGGVSRAQVMTWLELSGMCMQHYQWQQCSSTHLRPCSFSFTVHPWPATCAGFIYELLGSISVPRDADQSGYLTIAT